MSIKKIFPEDSQSVIDVLKNLTESDDDYIFRGHSKTEYELESTFKRFLEKTYQEIMIPSLSDFLDKFEVGMQRIEKMPTDVISELDRLEYARHYGLPSPCIDFSYSPYVAIFFALNRLNRSHNDWSDKKDYAVVYALSLRKMASNYAAFLLENNKDYTTTKKFGDIVNDFRFPYKNHKHLSQLFTTCHPQDILQFIPAPSKFNLRMIRQSGCFLYDSLDYMQLGKKNLEELISEFKELTLYKIYIEKKIIAEELLSQLELMGVLGMNLMNSPEGVVDDVINSYYYKSKTFLLRNQIEKNG
jgi:hypothetical protein